ncbi:hypothetical protein L3Q82_005934 [Scortum barcoo]|uniref:Uncharacterized protein n=1 Tax=Scortum barcoo TaxID=214431 RepID=A0ACB8X286_9TELE|nr:hypothetical protein L3Q82_005934 [Scortum barcoo]
MSRVVFGVSPSPFLLAATIRKHIKQYETEQPKTVEALRECLYVDDFIASSSDVDEALSVTTKAKEILSHAGMNLCKWITNSPERRAKWTERGMEHTTETATCGNVLKVLGLVWRSEKDDFVFDLKGLLDIMKGKENTKRNVLQTSARIFDPIGFLTPFTIRAKCLFQELWERGVGWDDQLPSDLAEKWDRWCAELPQLHQLDIPRWYQIDIKPDSQTVKLHVFCDASERAYSAVAYLQGENKEKEIVTSFVASKSKVAPLKKMTLPRLELMGALIGARLGNNLLKPLKMEINQLNMWTDSMIVLHWIRSTAQRWKPFVASRVAEIQGLTKRELWSHCNGKNNPADLPTRGQSVGEPRAKPVVVEWTQLTVIRRRNLIRHPPLPRPSLLCCNPHHALCPLSTAPPVPPHPLSRPSVHTYPQFTPTGHFHFTLCPVHLPPSTPPCSSLLLTTHQVRNALKKNRARKAAGPDGISSRLLKSCADQLCGIFRYTFNLSLKLGRVPQLWKTSCIVPVPKTPHPKELNSYRPVALTSHLMKTLERLVLAHLRPLVSSFMDPLQFAYQPDIGVDDAVIYLLHTSLTHLEKAGSTVRIMFFDFSSAFNTIQPRLLWDKLQLAGVDHHLTTWILDYLTHRPQFVRVQGFESDRLLCSTGAPQGTKFSDDSAVVGLITDGDDREYRGLIQDFADWCLRNNLQINAGKTKELVVDFRRRRHSPPAPVSIQGMDIDTVKSYKYLGVHLNDSLDWSDNTNALVKKGNSRLFLLRRLRSFGVQGPLLRTFL